MAMMLFMKQPGFKETLVQEMHRAAMAGAKMRDENLKKKNEGN